jgi:hypothetical protein
MPAKKRGGLPAVSLRYKDKEIPNPAGRPRLNLPPRVLKKTIANLRSYLIMSDLVHRI